MKQITILTFILTTVVGASVYSQVDVKQKVTFTISKVFWNVKGSFDEVEYEILLNPKDLENAKIQGRAFISNINTSAKKRDEHLQSDEWFDATKYPIIVISSLKIESVSNQQYKGLFDISIKGISKKKAIHFKIVEQNGTNYLVSEFTISLKDYNIGGGTLNYVIGNEAKVFLHLPF